MCAWVTAMASGCTGRVGQLAGWPCCWQPVTALSILSSSSRRTRIERLTLPPLDDDEIEGLVEALLFVADGPVEVERLATTLATTPDRIEQALVAWEARHRDGGLAITRSGNRLQMTTRPTAAPFIERFLGLDAGAKLSPAAMETLAIIAYLQPVTRARIDAIRGVSSAGVIRTLIARELVQVVGSLEQAGRPELLGTTFGFLQYLGLTSLDELPKLPQLEEALQAGALPAEGTAADEIPDASSSDA